MKKTNQRTNWIILVSSMIFFIGVILIGIIPAILTEESIWEKNTFLTILGFILGFTLSITLFVNIYLLLSTLQPYRTYHNYIKVIQIALYLLLIEFFMFDDVLLFSLNTRVIIFNITGVIILILNLIMYLSSKNEMENTLEKKWYAVPEHTPKLTNNEGLQLYYLGIGILYVASLIDVSLSNLGSYFTLVLMNAVIIYRYVKARKLDQQKIYYMVVISLVLTCVSIGVLSMNKELFEHTILLRMIIFVLPSCYLYPIIIKNYYAITWNENKKIYIK